MEIFTGIRSFHFQDVFPEDRDQRRCKPKSLELVKSSKWNAHFPFGSSVWELRSTFEKNPVFSPRKFPFGETKLIFLFIHSIRNFRILGVTGKQPVFQSSSRINLLAFYYECQSQMQSMKKKTDKISLNTLPVVYFE